jgi:hypothetical protein
VSCDVKVDEDANKISSKVEKVETIIVPIAHGQKSTSEDLDQLGFVACIETILPSRIAREPRWLAYVLQEAEEQVDAPKTSFWVSHPLKKFLSYVALVSSIIDAEHSSYVDATSVQVWRDAMVEYKSIMENDLCEIIPRPKRKSMVDFRWLYKVKDKADGNVEKYKVQFIVSGFI